MTRATLALLLALLGGVPAGDWWEDADAMTRQADAPAADDEGGRER